MKILHTADIHVDSPLRGLSAVGDAPVDELRGATRMAVENLVDLAVRDAVDCVVVAGDLYDSERDDYDTAVFLHRQFARLVESGIPVVLAYGNHDAASEITRRLRPPQGVRVLALDAPETVVLGDLGLAVHGQSYATRAITDNLSAAYPAPVPGMANVGVLHTALDGRPGHDPYAPCTVDGLVARGYAYWALGHVHQRDDIERDGQHIVFPGNLQGRHAKETGPKGATVVVFDGDRVVSATHHPLDVVRWVRVTVDVSGATDVDEVCTRVVDAVAGSPDVVDGMLCAIRVAVVGEMAATDRLVVDRQRWTTQLRADLAGSSGRRWLEKVELRTSRPERAAGAASDAVQAVRDLVATAAADPGLQAELAGIFDPLRTRLGAEAGALDAVGATGLGPAGVAALLPEVEALLLAELGGDRRAG